MYVKDRGHGHGKTNINSRKEREQSTGPLPVDAQPSSALSSYTTSCKLLWTYSLSEHVHMHLIATG